MPTYEYICQQCGRTFEALRSMKDSDAPIACASCSSMDTRRKLSCCNFSGSHENQTSTSSSGGCSGCHGGSCASCGH